MSQGSRYGSQARLPNSQSSISWAGLSMPQGTPWQGCQVDCSQEEEHNFCCSQPHEHFSCGMSQPCLSLSQNHAMDKPTTGQVTSLPIQRQHQLLRPQSRQMAPVSLRQQCLTPNHFKMHPPANAAHPTVSFRQKKPRCAVPEAPEKCVGIKRAATEILNALNPKTAAVSKVSETFQAARNQVAKQGLQQDCNPLIFTLLHGIDAKLTSLQDSFHLMSSANAQLHNWASSSTPNPNSASAGVVPGPCDADTRQDAGDNGKAEHLRRAKEPLPSAQSLRPKLTNISTQTSPEKKTWKTASKSDAVGGTAAVSEPCRHPCKSVPNATLHECEHQPSSGNRQGGCQPLAMLSAGGDSLHDPNRTGTRQGSGPVTSHDTTPGIPDKQRLIDSTPQQCTFGNLPATEHNTSAALEHPLAEYCRSKKEAPQIFEHQGAVPNSGQALPRQRSLRVSKEEIPSQKKADAIILQERKQQDPATSVAKNATESCSATIGERIKSRVRRGVLAHPPPGQSTAIAQTAFPKKCASLASANPSSKEVDTKSSMALREDRKAMHRVAATKATGVAPAVNQSSGTRPVANTGPKQLRQCLIQHNHQPSSVTTARVAEAPNKDKENVPATTRAAGGSQSMAQRRAAAAPPVKTADALMGVWRLKRSKRTEATLPAATKPTPSAQMHHHALAGQRQELKPAYKPVASCMALDARIQAAKLDRQKRLSGMR